VTEFRQPFHQPSWAKYAWFDPWVESCLEAIGLTVARISSPEKFLKLVGAEPLADDEPGGVLALADGSTCDQALVGVVPVPGGPGWVLGAESPSCVCYWKAQELSEAGGMAAALHFTEDSGGRFHWTANGMTLAEFSLTDGAAAGIDGTDPERLLEMLATAGLGADGTTEPGAAALALFEVIAGAVITQEVLAGGFTVGSVPDPYRLQV
jgi:hypothetical protein